MKVWMDGQLVDRSAAKLSVYDHSTLYGDGVFEGIRTYGNRIFQTQSHVDRLYESARAIRLAIPYSKQEIVDAMVETVQANRLGDSYIRLLVTRGEGNLGLNPFNCLRPSVVIINDYIQLYPKEMYEHGMAVIVAKTLRTSARMVPPSVKSLNYLNNILAKIECIDAGVSEAIMLNEHGNVAECTGDNIFIVKAGALRTPPGEAGILMGITRQVVLDLARKEGLGVCETDFTAQEVCAADECFLTGTAAEVIPVTKVDSAVVGTGKVGPVTHRLRTAFHDYIRGGQWE